MSWLILFLEDGKLKKDRQGNPKPDRRVEKSDADWRAQLSPEQYRITRQKGTERPHSGALCSIHDEGKYNCVCCDKAVLKQPFLS